MAAMDLAQLIHEVRKGDRDDNVERNSSGGASTRSTTSQELSENSTDEKLGKMGKRCTGDAIVPVTGDEPEASDEPTVNDDAKDDDVKDSAKDVFALQAESRAKRLAGRATAPKARNLGYLDARDLCGNWSDSFGNTVCVYSVDAYSPSLVATLSNPPRRDFNLPLTRLPNGGGWRCGGAMLNSVSRMELSWRFPNGKESVWRRHAVIPSVCNVMLPQMGMPADVNGKAGGVPEVMYCLIPMPIENN